MAALDAIPDVDLDPSGTFKYIQIQVQNDKTEGKTIVRGYASCSYHADILNKVRAQYRGQGYKFSCPGGGRIKHTPETNTLFVYGYSQGYGLADHQKTVDILKTAYPNYDISFSNDGY